MLDAMGDLYVAGRPIIGRYEGVRAGHALTGAVAGAAFRPDNYPDAMRAAGTGRVCPVQYQLA
jgi:UDP-3-O-acyl-N-acetylglucosamine deacetylase